MLLTAIEIGVLTAREQGASREVERSLARGRASFTMPGGAASCIASGRDRRGGNGVARLSLRAARPARVQPGRV